ncbi:MAG: hypothetical protein WC057_07350 [Dehalococcoidales bacterium]
MRPEQLATEGQTSPELVEKILKTPQPSTPAPAYRIKILPYGDSQ